MPESKNALGVRCRTHATEYAITQPDTPPANGVAVVQAECRCTPGEISALRTEIWPGDPTEATPAPARRRSGFSDALAMEAHALLALVHAMDTSPAGRAAIDEALAVLDETGFTQGAIVRRLIGEPSTGTPSPEARA